MSSSGAACSLECDGSPRPCNAGGRLETPEFTANKEDRQEGREEGRKAGRQAAVSATVGSQSTLVDVQKGVHAVNK